jgi:hypothetical protein
MAVCTRLYCGFEDAVEVFDLHSPGEGTRLATTPSKKSKDGLKGSQRGVICDILPFSFTTQTGIISALTFSPSHDIYAAGNLASSTSNIALFSESENKTSTVRYCRCKGGCHTNDVVAWGGSPNDRTRIRLPHWEGLNLQIRRCKNNLVEIYIRCT